MATRKTPIYNEENSVVNVDLMDQLNAAVDILVENMKTTIPINRTTALNSQCVGYGVSKLNRSIAADRVISIAKAIKSLKGW